jgi:hypothetical protein
MRIDDRTQPGGNVSSGVVPRHDMELSVDAAAQRVVQTVRIVMHVKGGDALGAGEPLADRVVVVGTYRTQHPGVVDVGHQPARRLAHSAECPNAPILLHRIIVRVIGSLTGVVKSGTLVSMPLRSPFARASVVATAFVFAFASSGLAAAASPPLIPSQFNPSQDGTTVQASALSTNRGLVPLSPARLLDTRREGSTVDGLAKGAGALGADATMDLAVIGRGGVPSSEVAAVVLNVTATGATASSFVTVYPSGEARPNASSLNVAAGQTVPNQVIAKLGGGGIVRLYNYAGSVHLIADVVGWIPIDGWFIPVSPARLLDSRPNPVTVDGVRGALHALGPGEVIDLPVTSRGGIPSTGVAAVALNVTATGASTTSFVTVWPTGETRPNASSLNIAPGQTTPNLVVVKLGSTGLVSLYNYAGNVDLIADVVGWIPIEAGITAVSPARLLDTRSTGQTIDGRSRAQGALGADGVVELPIAGRGGVPTTGVSAVWLNVTATDASTASFVTAWPSGEVRPNASSLNIEAGQTVPNLVLAKLGTSGAVSLYNYGGNVQLIADVVAWTAEAAPARLAGSPTLASNSSTTCAITVSGATQCWGAYPGAPLSSGSLQIQAMAGLFPGPTDAVMLSGGERQCAIRTDRTVACFADRPAAGINYPPANPQVVGLAAGTNVVAIGGGGSGTCTASAGGSVQCWPRVGASTPTEIVGVRSPSRVAVGLGTACALLTYGGVQCWGTPGDVNASVPPTGIAGTLDAVQLAYNSQRGCIARSDGTVSCWEGMKTPTQVGGIDDTIAVATTTLSSCALKRDHTVWCWGDNTVGQLGNGTTTNSTTPVQVVGITNATAITGGESHMCALLDSGSVRCWGRESLGQLGRGRNYQNTPAAELYSSVPVAVVGLAPIRQP